MPRRNLIAVVLGLGMIGSTADFLHAQQFAYGAAAPAATNQNVANAVSLVLSQSPYAQRFRVAIQVTQGTVQLSGCVAEPWVRQEVLTRVWSVPGVYAVRDHLAVVDQHLVRVQANAEQGPPPDRVPASGMPQEPMGIGQTETGAAAGQPPIMPPYAWPAFAPYNNYSRVAYPNLYPYQAWPFIGPFYPFPKVPPGWRSINLTWEDGFWWYGKGVTGHDWWRIRYY